MSWGFYGRASELDSLTQILARNRWFFCRVTGRRRIGKTTLVQKAIETARDRHVLYVQIPDSAAAGVLSAVADAMETFGIDPVRFPRPTTLHELAQSIGALASAGYLVAIDEFQYFSRKVVYEFTSHLQSVIDDLSRRASEVRGGLFVLGSIHTELVAMLEDRAAPLYSRTTDHLEVDHLDIASVLSILREHATASPKQLLFLWNLFEGVPKFYRDCYEQEAYNTGPDGLVQRMFFRSSSPLRSEAEHWFLSELRGRYDVVLKYVARHPGCSHGEVEGYVRQVSPATTEQVGGYLKYLTEKFRMIEKRLPVFAKLRARRGRYYIRDNFLRVWLNSLQSPVSAINFRPEETLVAQAVKRLRQSEGHGLERLTAQLYEERARKGLGDFALTRRIDGYWDRGDTEIDLVAVNEDERAIRFGTCKRSAEQLPRDLTNMDGHIDRFLNAHRKYREWRIEKVAIAPEIEDSLRRVIERGGYIPQDLNDLTKGL